MSDAVLIGVFTILGGVGGGALTVIGAGWSENRRESQRLLQAGVAVLNELADNEDRLRADRPSAELTVGDWGAHKVALASLRFRHPDLCTKLFETYTRIYEARSHGQDAPKPDDVQQLRVELSAAVDKIEDELNAPWWRTMLRRPLSRRGLAAASPASRRGPPAESRSGPLESP